MKFDDIDFVDLFGSLCQVVALDSQICFVKVGRFGWHGMFRAVSAMCFILHVWGEKILKDVRVYFQIGFDVYSTQADSITKMAHTNRSGQIWPRFLFGPICLCKESCSMFKFKGKRNSEPRVVAGTCLIDSNTFTNQNLEKRRVHLKTRGFHVKPGVFKTRKNNGLIRAKYGFSMG